MVFTTSGADRSSNLTDAGRKAAEIKAQKRAAALRENLKRRKEQAKPNSHGQARAKVQKSYRWKYDYSNSML